MFSLRILIAALVSTMLTLTSVCWASMNNHACCGDATSFTAQAPHSERALCCLTPTAIEAKSTQYQFSSDSDNSLLPAVTPETANFRFYEALLQPAQQSLFHHQYIADQSDRHMELSVLLN